MKLIYSPASPFVRKVLVLAHELGMIDQIELHSVQTTALNTAEDARAANPLGKIPALVRENNSTLFDSRVICEYINDVAKGNMYPKEGYYDVLTLEALADGIMESAVLVTYEKRLRPEEQQSDAWMTAQWGKIIAALDALEAETMPGMSGPLNMAQLAIACALSYLDFRHDSRNWRSGHDKLAQWYAEMAQRPSLQATEPQG